MRAPILALFALLAVPPAAVAQPNWARAYDQGKKAFEEGNCAVAESKMLEARESGPKQKRRHAWSSVDFRPFIPDYYLGLCAEKQGQAQKAERYLEFAIKEKLVVEDDRDYGVATAALQRAKQQILAANKPATPQPKIDTPPVGPVTPTNTGTVATNQPANQPGTGTNQPGTATPGAQTATNATTTPTTIRTTPTTTPTTLPPPPVEPAWKAEFRRSMEASRTSLRAGRYGEAYSGVRGAIRIAVAAGDSPSRQQAEQLQAEIERDRGAAAQRLATQARAAVQAKNIEGAAALLTSLETLDASHPALGQIQAELARLREAVTGTARLALVERTAVKQFLSGNYKQSEAGLQDAVSKGVYSPRIYLFLASSRAAQALLAKESERQRLVEEARKAYALGGPGIGALSADRKFISPAILRLLGAS